MEKKLFYSSYFVITKGFPKQTCKANYGGCSVSCRRHAQPWEGLRAWSWNFRYLYMTLSVPKGCYRARATPGIFSFLPKLPYQRSHSTFPQSQHLSCPQTIVRASTAPHLLLLTFSICLLGRHFSWAHGATQTPGHHPFPSSPIFGHNWALPQSRKQLLVWSWAIVQRVRCLPCGWLTLFPSPVPYKVPWVS